MGTIDWVDMQDINGTLGQPTRGMNAANVESQVTTIAKTSIMYPAVLTAFSLCAILLLALFLLTHNSCCHKRKAAKGKKEEREIEEIAGTHHTAKIFYDIPDQSHPKLTSVLQQEDNDIASEVNEHYKVGDCNRAIICCPDKDGYVYDPHRGNKRFESPTDETTSGTMPNTTSTETSCKDSFETKNANKSSRSEPVTSKDKKGISMAIKHLTEALNKERRARAMTRTQSLSSTRDLKDSKSHNKRISEKHKKRTKSFDPNLERAFCLPREKDRKKAKKTRRDKTKSPTKQDQGPSSLATPKGDRQDDLLYGSKDQIQQSTVPAETIKNETEEENSKIHGTFTSKELVMDVATKHVERKLQDTCKDADEVTGSNSAKDFKSTKAQDRPRLFSEKELKHTVDFKGLLIDRWVDDTIKRQGTSPTDKESETTWEIQTQLNLLYDDADSILTSVSRMDEKRLKRLRESKFYKTALNTQKEEQDLAEDRNEELSKQDENKRAAGKEHKSDIKNDGKTKTRGQNNKRDANDIIKHRKKKTNLSSDNIIPSNENDNHESLAGSQIPDGSQKNVEIRKEKTKQRTSRDEQRSIKTVNATICGAGHAHEGDSQSQQPRWEEVSRTEEGKVFSDLNEDENHFTSLENNQTSTPGERELVTGMAQSKQHVKGKNDVFMNIEKNIGKEQLLSIVEHPRIPSHKHVTQKRQMLGKQANEEKRTFHELHDEKVTHPRKILRRQNSERTKHRHRREQPSKDTLDEITSTEQTTFDFNGQSVSSDNYFRSKGTSHTQNKGDNEYQSVVDDHNVRYWDLHDNIVTDSEATYEPSAPRAQTHQRPTTDDTYYMGEGTSSERWVPKDASTGINSGMVRQSTLQMQYREKDKERANNPSVSFSILKNFKNARKPIIYVSLSKLSNLSQMEKNYSGQLIIRSYLQKHLNSIQESKPFECKDIVHVKELFIIRGSSTEKLLEDKLIFDFLTVPDKVLLGNVQVSLGELIDKGSVSRTDIIDLPTLQDTVYRHTM